jgi:PAS domain S-box-containing protein
VVQLIAALLKRWPFRVRYSVLFTTTVLLLVLVATTVGITPTWVVMVFMLMSATGLCFGMLPGVAMAAVCAVFTVAVAWGWTRGYLPLGSAAESTAIFNYHDPLVWVRVALTTGVCVAGLLHVMQYVLRSLSNAMAESNATWQKLLAEQEHRAQVAEALASSETRFARVFQGSPISIVITELKSGRVVDANEAFYRVYDCRREDVIGRTSLELGLWQDHDRDRVLQALRSGTPVRDFRVKGRKISGAPMTVLVNCEVLELDDQPCLLTMVQDVTDQEAAELALRSSEEKFSNAFYANPNPMIITDPASGRVIDANGAFFRAAKNSPREQVIGRTTVELGLWQDAKDRELHSEMLRTKGMVRDFRVYGQTLRGDLAVVLLNSELIELEGRPAVLTMMQDITEQERAEHALRESEEKFARAFHCGPTANTITDLTTGRYIEVSEGFEKLTGYSRDEAVGRTSVELGIWTSTDQRDAFMAKLNTEGAVHAYELETVNRRGERIVCVINADCLTLGGRRCVVMAAQDITPLKRAEAERAIAAERELRARDEFTRGLIAAQEAERARIAGELHDSLGQNLLLLKNRAELALVDAKTDSGTRPPLENIRDMAARAVAEVRQISHDLHPYQLDQVGLTCALDAMIKNAAHSTGIPFRQKLENADDVFSKEDATHVFRIVQESINNILKHACATSASILLERDIDRARLVIEDDGVGFVPSSPGFGLKNIAERVRIIGGEMKLRSAPGLGTHLEIVLPFAPDAD